MKTYNLDNDTPLVPEIIADSVTQDKDLSALICERLRWHYANTPSFRKKLRGAKCREFAKSFLDHWTAAGLQRMTEWRASHAQP